MNSVWKEKADLGSGRGHLQLILAFVALSLIAADTPTTVGTANEQGFLTDIKSLTAPAMEGRGAGTKGLTRAAHLIEQRYKSLGLQPTGKNGFFQPFDVITGAQLRPGNELAKYVQGVDSLHARETFKLNEDFVPLSFSANGSVSSSAVFAGYGITAPEFGYDDYAELNVKDGIVVVLRKEPPGLAKKSGSSEPTLHAGLVTKAINARNHGAKAIIFLNGILDAAEDDLFPRFETSEGPIDVGILCLQVKNKVAFSWLHADGQSVTDMQKGIDESTQPSSLHPSFPLNLTVRVNIERLHATVSNILAYLPGKTDDYVILGAHYDHLGRGQSHSLAPSQMGQIHPGADDNASGTAGVLELSRLFAPLKAQLHARILFANFAGQELGLLGSAEWVKNPTLPLDKAVAMLNMDMIGRIKDDKVYIGGLGTGTTFQPILDRKSTRLNSSHTVISYAVFCLKKKKKKKVKEDNNKSTSILYNTETHTHITIAQI